MVLTGDGPGLRDMQRRSWSFGIVSLLGATAGIAVGLAVATGERGAIERGFLATVSTWIVFSLVAQAWRLKRESQRLGDAATNQRRWGWRLEIGWRVAAAIILSATVVMDVAHLKIDVLTVGWSMVRFPLNTIGLGIQMMCLAFVLGSGSWLAAKKHVRGWRRAWRIALNAVAYVAIGALALVVLYDAGFVVALVRISIQGIEQSRAQWHLPLAVKKVGADWDSLFSWLSLAAAVAAVANLGFLGTVCGRIYRRRGDWLLTAPFALSLAATIAWPVWAKRYGFSLLSPALGDSPPETSPLVWIGSGLAIGLAAFAVLYKSWRRAARREAATLWNNEPELCAPPLSLHESRWGACLLAIALLIGIGYEPYRVASEIASMGFNAEFLNSVYLASLVHGPDQQFQLAALAAAVAAAFRSHAPALRIATQPPLEVNLLRFLVMWLLATATIFAALACLALFAFGMWLSPMMRW
jgi:hypothetical protein